MYRSITNDKNKQRNTNFIWILGGTFSSKLEYSAKIRVPNSLFGTRITILRHHDHDLIHQGFAIDQLVVTGCRCSRDRRLGRIFGHRCATKGLGIEVARVVDIVHDAGTVGFLERTNHGITVGRSKHGLPQILARHIAHRRNAGQVETTVLVRHCVGRTTTAATVNQRFHGLGRTKITGHECTKQDD